MDIQLNIEMVVDAANDGLSHELTDSHRNLLVAQLDEAYVNFQAWWTEALEDQLATEAISNFPSEGYFQKKLSAFMSFARMAIGAEERESYSPDLIRRNVKDFGEQMASIIRQASFSPDSSTRT